MDLKALKRIVVARWWVLVLVVVAALAVSSRLSEYRDEALPQAEVVTWVTFIEDPAALERDEFESLLEIQGALAQTVNSDVVNRTPGPFIPWRLAEIEIEFDQNQIQFIGRGDTEAEATQLASEMRSRFLAASSIGAGRDRINAELDELTVQIGELRSTIAAAQAPVPLTDEQLAQQSRRETITAQVSALRGHLAGLRVELISPVTRTAGEIRQDMTETQTAIDELEAELADIPSIEPPVNDAADLQLLLNELQLQNLEQRWETLYQSERVLAALASEGDVVTQPLTVDVPSEASNTALAVVSALAIAIAALIAYERARGITWTTNDLDLEVEPAVFLEVAPRGLDVFQRPSRQFWYLNAPRGRRKAAVQTVRGALEDYQHAVVALQGTGVNQADIREFAADVALATAVSGRKVLLLGTAFDVANDLQEFGATTNISVADLLLADVEGLAMETVYKSALTSQPEVSHSLTALRAGDIDHDAADLVSTPKFETLLRVAQGIFDLVIVAGVEVEDPASHVVAKRVDSVVVLGSVGHTVSDNVEAAVRDFRVRNTHLLGVAMIRKRRGRIQRWAGNRVRRTLWRFMDWVRSLREVKPVTVSGFQSNLDRFGVTNPDNLSESRYADVEGDAVFAEAVEARSGEDYAE